MITLKSPREIEEMAKSGAILAGMHIGLREIIKPGISSWEIEKFARKYFKEHGAIAEQIGFEGYKYATCVSVNDEICHGFPRKNLILRDGDLIKVDTVVNYHGAMSDSCWRYRSCDSALYRRRKRLWRRARIYRTRNRTNDA